MSKKIKDKKEHDILSINLKLIDIIFILFSLLIILILAKSSINYLLGKPSLLTSVSTSSSKQTMLPIVVLIVSINANLLSKKR